MVTANYSHHEGTSPTGTTTHVIPAEYPQGAFSVPVPRFLHDFYILIKTSHLSNIYFLKIILSSHTMIIYLILKGTVTLKDIVVTCYLAQYLLTAWSTYLPSDILRNLKRLNWMHFAIGHNVLLN